MPDDQNHPAQTAGQPAPQAEPQTAKQRYDEAGGDELPPLERLHFFCACAMKGQDWFDFEPIYYAVAGAVQPAAPAERKAVLHWSDGSRTVVPCPPDDTATYTAKLVQPAADALTEENRELRQLLCDVLKALGNGSGAVPECSMQFMRWIPGEVEAVVRGTAPKAAEPPGAVPKSPYFSGSEP